MLGRAAVDDATLTEMGWLTINFGGLEDLLIIFTAAILNPDDQKPTADVIARMSFREKRETLARVFALRCQQTGLTLNDKLKSALKRSEAAGEARNAIVHGLADYVGGVPLLRRPGKPAVPATVEEIRRVNALIFEAKTALLTVFTEFWNATKGHYPAASANHL